MTAALRLVPTPPRSDVRPVSPVEFARLRVRAEALVQHVDEAVRVLKAEAAERYDGSVHRNAWAAFDRLVAARRAAEARALRDAADELAWLAAGCPLPSKVQP